MMRRVRIFSCAILIDICFIIFSVSSSHSNEIPPSIRTGISFLLMQDYARADSCWLSIPDDSEYRLEREFYPLMTIVVRYIDLEESELTEESFLGRLEAVTQLCRKRIEEDSDDMYARLYLGYSYAFMAMYYNFRKNLPSMLAYGLKSVSELSQCIEVDSTFKEPYIAVGSYKYWRSSFLRKLWIPFVGDGRDEGIALVKEGIGSPLGDYLAWNQLAWIYIDYERYDSAVDAAETALERYPGNRIMHWAKAIAYNKAKQFDKSADEFAVILRSLEQDGHHTLDVYYRVLLLQAEALYRNEQYDKTSVICSNIIAIRTKPNVSDKQKSLIKRAEKLMEQCDDKM